MAVAGAPFGKEHDGDAVGQRIAQVLGLLMHLAPCRARDENGVIHARQPADQRPAAHLVLGDEARAGGAGHRQDIQPAQMVGDEEDILRERPADELYVNAGGTRGGAKESTRPGRGTPRQSPQPVQRHMDQQQYDDQPTTPHHAQARGQRAVHTPTGGLSPCG